MSEAKQEPLNIYQRLHACIRDAETVEKKRKQGIPFSFASHDAVTQSARKVFLQHGIYCESTVAAQSVEHLGQNKNGNEVYRTEVDLKVDFVNIDDPKDRVETMAFGYGIDNADKGPGKAVSYAHKYAMLKALMLETGDDAEASDQSHSHSVPAKDDKHQSHLQEINRGIAKLLEHQGKDKTAENRDALLLKLTANPPKFDGWQAMEKLAKASPQAASITVSEVRKALSEIQEPDPNVDDYGGTDETDGALDPGPADYAGPSDSEIPF